MKERDGAETAHGVLSRVIEISEVNSEQREKDPAAVELGRRGGLKGGSKGGKARAAKLSAERRTEIARLAAETRWRRTKDRGD